MGINHDKLVLDWKKNVHCPSSKPADDEDRGSTSEDKRIDEENEDGDVDLIPCAGMERDLPADQSVIIIGDNWDKNIRPRDMRSKNQVKSLHLFHVIAVVSHIKTLHLNDTQSTGNVRDIPIADFLPSIKDCTAICDNYVVIIARVITENIKHFSSLHDCVPMHIHHEYSAKMSLKTAVVSAVNMLLLILNSIIFM